MLKTPHWPKMLGKRPVKFGLERVSELLSRIGNPHRKLPPVIHVAGTNGKGSTISFMRAMLESAGYTVHVYTSPNLVYFNERIVLAGDMISDAMLFDVMEDCKNAAGDMEITFFEGITVGAMLAFSRVDADILLLETGCGGRLDATNVVENPILTVITSISYDHMHWLGESLGEIAAEKAGILKRKVPCVISHQEKEAYESIKKIADAKEVPLFVCDTNIKLPKLALSGKHQIMNACTAVESIKHLESFDVPKTSIEEGLQKATWRGRLQKLKYGELVNMLSEGSEIWIDGGHNEAAGEALAEQCRLWKSEDNRPIYLIVGMSEGKDAANFLEPMSEYVEECHVITLPEELLRQTIEEMLNAAKRAGMKGVQADGIDEAVYAIINASESAVRIFICGSLYLVGTVLAENG